MLMSKLCWAIADDLQKLTGFTILLTTGRTKNSRKYAAQLSADITTRLDTIEHAIGEIRQLNEADLSGELGVEHALEDGGQ